MKKLPPLVGGSCSQPARLGVPVYDVWIVAPRIGGSGPLTHPEKEAVGGFRQPLFFRKMELVPFQKTAGFPFRVERRTRLEARFWGRVTEQVLFYDRLTGTPTGRSLPIGAGITLFFQKH